MKPPELTKWLRDNSSALPAAALEAADLIDRLTAMLQGVTGTMDALKIMSDLSTLKPAEKKAFLTSSAQLRDVLDETLPEWDDLLREISSANA